MEKNIYNKLFDLNDDIAKEMENKNIYCDCFAVNGLMFVILNKIFTNSEKIVIEVGTLTSELLFNLKYLLIYNTENDFHNHLKLIDSQIGIKSFFDTLQFVSGDIQNIEDIKTGQQIGYICNYSKKNNENDFPVEPIQPIQPVEPIIPIKQYIPIKQKFSNPPGIGLQNVGATCYMNATIQCFCQIEKFVDYFKSHQRINDIIDEYKNKNEDCLTTSFKYLIENLWPTDKSYQDKKYNLKNSNNKYFVPKEFKEKISKMNPLFEGVKANDSKDLVNYIIMRLHEELNEGIKYENNIAPSQEDEISMFNFFQQSYFQENKSIICDLFCGINGTLYECSSCHTKKYNYQMGFFYIFPLEEVRKFKIQNLQNEYLQKMQLQMQMQIQMGQIIPYMNNMNNMMLFSQPYFANIQNINTVSMKDCFDFNQKIETMAGENSMYCNICKRQEIAYYHSYIVTSPEIIVMILNRGKGIEFNVKLEFTEYLNIQDYVRIKNNNSCNYKLIGVVTHLGESGASGHFIAYCRSPIDNKWYNYNDDLFFPVTDFKKQVIDYAMPYILFYQKI